MSRKKRPSFITEEEKQDTCSNCSIVNKCAILNFVNKMAMIKQGSKLTNEFGCVYFEQYSSNNKG